MACHLPFFHEEAPTHESAEVDVAEAEAAQRTLKQERGGARSGVRWTWRRQLWLVILADLMLLYMLFTAWLAVCRGSSCIGLDVIQMIDLSFTFIGLDVESVAPWFGFEGAD